MRKLAKTKKDQTIGLGASYFVKVTRKVLLSGALVLTAMVAVLAMASENSLGNPNVPGWHKNKVEAHPYFSAGKKISGKILLGQDLIDRGYAKANFSFKSDDVIYVIAKKNKKPGTPPVAVVRMGDLTKKKFPITFSIGPKDLMLKEGSFVGPFFLKIKLSRHGDAATAAGDLIGYSVGDEIKMGAENVEVRFSEVAGSDGSMGAAHAGPSSTEMESRAKMALIQGISAKSSSRDGRTNTPKSKSANAQRSSGVARTSASALSADSADIKNKMAAIEGVVGVASDLQKKLKKSKFKFKSTDVLFIVAKDAGSPGMVPLAVLRIDNLKGKTFPIPFRLTAANMMTGTPDGFKGALLLKAKVSRQGGVMTQSGDLYVGYKGSSEVLVGSSGVTVLLDKIK